MKENTSLLAVLFFLCLSLFLIVLNAFFVASEFAIVKVRRTRLEELAGQGIAAARVSILCVERLDEYLSATQLGITIVSLALGWIGEETFYNLFLICFPKLIKSSTHFHFIAIGLSFLLITTLHVVLGELVPKSMAIQRAEKVTLFVSRPLSLFYRMAKPLIHLFTSIANFVLHVLGYHGLEEPPLSEEELKLVMKESREDGVISESEAQIINRAFSFSDKRALDIMIHASQVESLSLSKTFEHNLKITRQNMHTRFPLTQEGFSTVIGVVHVKDLVQSLLKDYSDPLSSSQAPSNDVFKKVARPALFVDPLMREDKLMKAFKDRRAHLAIVQDSKTKENLGIVTMEDILEELVGDIQDEHGH